MDEETKLIEYKCDKCEFKTYRESHWNRHLNTKKHKKYYILNKDNLFECVCGKLYKHRQSLNNHRKKCDTVSVAESFFIPNQMGDQDSELNNGSLIKIPYQKGTNDPDWKEMFLTLIEQNQKLMELTVNVASQPKTVNNQFNIMNYLNTECKDAVNLTDFIEQLQYTFADLNKITDEGWVTNVQNTLIRELKEMEEHKRPIHCSDRKRKKFYVKEHNTWERDDKQERIQRALRHFHNKQSRTYIKWKNMNREIVEKNDDMHDKALFMNLELCKVSCENGYKMKNKLVNSLTDLVIEKK